MPTPRFALIAYASVVVMLSCTDAPDISSELNEYERLVNDTNGVACECPLDLGFAGSSECLEVYGTVSADERQCLGDALVGAEDEGKAYLDCANTSLQFYLQCLEANVSCDDGGYDQCRGPFDADIAACPALPADAKSAFDACIPWP